MLERRKISGEYTMVGRRSKNYALLKQLHETACTQEEALSIVKTVSHQYGITVSVVRFREGVRGRAYCKTFALSLPATPGAGFGRLRVGIVLHELAHLIAFHRFKERAHRRPFLSLLDYLGHEWSKHHGNSD